MHFWRSYCHCRHRRHCVNFLTHIPEGYVNLVKLPFSENPWDHVSNNREAKMSPWRRKRECQKNNPFKKSKWQLSTCITQCLYISLPHCTTYNMKLPNDNILLATWPYDDKLLFLLKNLDIFLKIQIQEISLTLEKVSELRSLRRSLKENAKSLFKWCYRGRYRIYWCLFGFL